MRGIVAYEPPIYEAHEYYQSIIIGIYIRLLGAFHRRNLQSIWTAELLEIVSKKGFKNASNPGYRSDWTNPS